MGKLSKYLFGIMAAAMLAGCSDELPADDPGKLNISDDGSGFFMALDIQMPGGTTGSRSTTTEPDDGQSTSSSGVEVGQDYENNVTSALIVLAAMDDNAGANGEVKENQTHYEKYGFIAASTVLSNRLSTAISEGNKQYKAVARLQKANLEAFYQSTEAGTNGGRQVYVFVFCNPTAELSGLFEGTTVLSGSEGEKLTIGSAAWMEQTCSVIQGNPTLPNTNIGIWGSNSFLMNNVKMETRLLPNQLMDWEKFTAPENAFHLSDANVVEGTTYADNSESGAVKVERSVARFDFRDGSRNAKGEANDNTYTVLYTGDGEGTADAETGVALVDVQIQKMCLVNMSNNFYYLPRVSGNGTPNGDKFAYCGPEIPWNRVNGVYTGGNYVVGPYWSTFANSNQVNSGFGTYFNFPFFADTEDELVSFDNGNWDVVEVTDVLNGTRDNYDGSNGNAQEGDPGVPLRPKDFTIWRYVTENVIPAPPGNQKNGISTGIVFKAKLQGATLPADMTPYEEAWDKGSYNNLVNCLNGKPFTYEGKENVTLTGNSAEDPFLYYIDGHLYLGWRHIRQAAIQAAVTVNVSGIIEINRSNSLYKAVFGDGPIPPTYEMNGKTYTSIYINSKGESMDIVDATWPYGKNDELLPGNTEESADAIIANYHASADYKWMVWHEAGRPDESGSESERQLLAAMREAMTDANITIYQSSIDNSKAFGSVPGYYCYYYYWNRHNDNGIAGTMAPMEFAVVRNNVYKLSVDKISRLGHPRIPDNDPDNPTPQTPDESDKIYLDVQVQIIPWVVRVNSIVF